MLPVAEEWVTGAQHALVLDKDGRTVRWCSYERIGPGGPFVPNLETRVIRSHSSSGPSKGSVVPPRPKLRRKLAKLMDPRGAAVIEYGLMMALIAIVIIVAVSSVGSKLSVIFDTVASSI
jgi:pilus assembly protein Flp/PilA